MIGGGSLYINAGLNGIDDRHNGTFTIKDVASYYVLFRNYNCTKQ